ncbi:MAG: 2-hydroxyacyl-CoA dehydratase family protein [Sporomusaceae bacterium]|nr:2-hydroxyacyl-CoA dehydratase family protein [Sporomusaceae bacterium]
MSPIGMTTTVPVEIILASGRKPVDLNNIFITHDNPNSYLETAEEAGFPRNCCGWIKGLYSVALEQDAIQEVIAVTQGDCSNTQALMETYQLEGIKTIPFAYPEDRDYDMLKLQMEKLISALGTTWDATYEVKERLKSVREKLVELDRLTWETNQVNGFYNHLYLVSSSDFNGDVGAFEAELDTFLAEAKSKNPYEQKLRLGFIGVPPIMPEIYDYVETQGARVVFNEVQRQFSMPNQENDLVEQYRRYTYPYGVFPRLADIEEQIELRHLDGLIHYVQSFCFRQIEDIIFRKKLEIPMLTIEGDRPGKLDARTKLRLDSFLEMLK